MPWTLAAAALLITSVSLVVAFSRKPSAPGAPATPREPAPPEASAPDGSADRTPIERPIEAEIETSGIRRSRSSIDADDLPLLSDDDDDDITIVTLGPRPAMPMSAFDDDDVPAPGPEAVPIVYDQDAAEDEPTKIEELFLVSAAGQTDTG